MKRNHSLALTLGGIALGAWALRQATAGDFAFQGKVVVITGGSRGLGLVLARKVCAQGGRVVLLARDRAELQRAHDELARDGGNVSILPCDLLERSQIE